MFKRRPYDPKRADKRSPAQRAANDRSFQIFQLRGLWSLSGRVTEPRRSLIRQLIDEDIRALGAEPEGERQRERRIQLETAWAASGLPEFTDI